MLAIAFVTLESEIRHEAPPLRSELPAGHDPLGKELARCATQIPPDASCAAVWDAHAEPLPLVEQPQEAAEVRVAPVDDYPARLGQALRAAGAAVCGPIRKL